MAVSFAGQKMCRPGIEKQKSRRRYPCLRLFKGYLIRFMAAQADAYKNSSNNTRKICLLG
jgi:hypothetical protein